MPGWRDKTCKCSCGYGPKFQLAPLLAASQSSVLLFRLPCFIWKRFRHTLLAKHILSTINFCKFGILSLKTWKMNQCPHLIWELWSSQSAQGLLLSKCQSLNPLAPPGPTFIPPPTRGASRNKRVQLEGSQPTDPVLVRTFSPPASGVCTYVYVSLSLWYSY